jgi:hypothetical protein
VEAILVERRAPPGSGGFVRLGPARERALAALGVTEKIFEGRELRAFFALFDKKCH